MNHHNCPDGAHIYFSKSNSAGLNKTSKYLKFNAMTFIFTLFTNFFTLDFLFKIKAQIYLSIIRYIISSNLSGHAHTFYLFVLGCL